jgi:hypothetical protein
MSSSRAIGDSGSDLGSSQNLDDRQAEQAREAQKLNQIIQVCIPFEFCLAGIRLTLFDSNFFPKEL